MKKELRIWWRDRSKFLKEASREECRTWESKDDEYVKEITQLIETKSE